MKHKKRGGTKYGKDPKTQNSRTKTYFYRFACKCDRKTSPISDVFDAYIKRQTDVTIIDVTVPYFDKYYYLDLRRHKSDNDVCSGAFKL